MKTQQNLLKFQFFKHILLIVSILGIFTLGSTMTAFAADDSDNVTMSQVSEAASDPAVYQGSTKDNPLLGLRDVSRDWSYLGLNTKSGLLKSGKNNTAEMPISGLIISNDKSDGSTESTNAVTKAAQLPVVLSQHGLDKSTANSGAMSGMFRWVGAVLLIAVMLIMFITNFLLSIVMWLIQNLNPLVLIQTAFSGSGYSLFSVKSSIENIPVIGDLFVTGIGGSIFTLLLSIAIPALVAMGIAALISLVIWAPYSNKSRGSFINGFKWIAKRLAIIFIVPSVAGSLFLSVLDLASFGTTSPGALANKQTVSTFVNFKDWANQSRLYMPNASANGQKPLLADLPSGNDDGWSYSSPAVTTISPNYILKINQLGAHDAIALGITADSDSVVTSTGGDSTDTSTLRGTEKFTLSGVSSSAFDISTNTGKLIQRIWAWGSGEKFDASSYAGQIEKQYNSEIGSSKNPESEILADINKYKDDTSNKLTTGATANGQTISPYLVTGDGGIGYKNDSTGYGANSTTNPTVSAGQAAKLINTNQAGLSPVGMWNYLNTTVSGDTISQEIASKTQNTQSTSHYSYIIGGSTIQAISSYFLLVAVIAAGLIPTLVATVVLSKQAFSGLTQVPHMGMAFVGSVKAWIYLFRYALQVIISVLFVGISSMFVPSLIDGILTLFNSSISTNDFLSNAWGFAGLQLVETVILLLLTYLLAKVFGGSGKFVDQMVSIGTGKGKGYDALNKGASLFDSNISRGIDDMTRNSNSKFGRMLNEANLDEGMRNKNIAKDVNGNPYRDEHGQLVNPNDMTLAQKIGEDGKPMTDKDGNPIMQLRPKRRDDKDTSLTDDAKELYDKFRHNENGLNNEMQDLKDKMAQTQNSLAADGVDIAAASQDPEGYANSMVQSGLNPKQSTLEALHSLAADKEKLATLESTKGATDAVNAIDGLSASADNIDVKAAEKLSKTAAGTFATSNMLSAMDGKNLIADTRAKLAQSEALSNGSAVDDSIAGGLSSETVSSFDSQGTAAIDNLSKKASVNISNFDGLATKELEKWDSSEASITAAHKTAQAASIERLGSINSTIARELSNSNLPKNQLSNLSNFDSQANIQNFNGGESKFVTDAVNRNLDQNESVTAYDSQRTFDRSMNSINSFASGVYQNMSSVGDRSKVANAAMKGHLGAVENVKQELLANKQFENANDPKLRSAAEAIVVSRQPDAFSALENSIAKAEEEHNKGQAALAKADKYYKPVKFNAVKAREDAYKRATQSTGPDHLIPFKPGYANAMVAGRGKEVMNNRETYHKETSDYERKMSNMKTSRDKFANFSDTSLVTNAAKYDFKKLNAKTFKPLNKYVTANSNPSLTVGKVQSSIENYHKKLEEYNRFRPMSPSGNYTAGEKAKYNDLTANINNMRNEMIKSGISSYHLQDITKVEAMQDDLEQYSNILVDKYRKAYQGNIGEDVSI